MVFYSNENLFSFFARKALVTQGKRRKFCSIYSVDFLFIFSWQVGLIEHVTRNCTKQVVVNPILEENSKSYDYKNYKLSIC